MLHCRSLRGKELYGYGHTSLGVLGRFDCQSYVRHTLLTGRKRAVPGGTVPDSRLGALCVKTALRIGDIARFSAKCQDFVLAKMLLTLEFKGRKPEDSGGTSIIRAVMQHLVYSIPKACHPPLTSTDTDALGTDMPRKAISAISGKNGKAITRVNSTPLDLSAQVPSPAWFVFVRRAASGDIV
ncbi:hypothetical protein D9613_012647 [Agrocybe pediades]|uniref:Uncharacterized protein n=1 Tax=Agrocybe pediades TaxID=84607 RepID=A0A8H4QVR5_9AGAR|nr:hypothetical protein D9613_012647 [Agrocybe pediades]